MRTIDAIVKPRREHVYAYTRLERDVFRRPWWWLGLTRERWLDTPFEQRVLLFVPFGKQ